MTYKGFNGVFEFDEEAKIYSGSVSNIKDVITFHGSTLEELELEFHASVDDYLEWCEEDELMEG